jgi:hypothetical protein
VQTTQPLNSIHMLKLFQLIHTTVLDLKPIDENIAS